MVESLHRDIRHTAKLGAAGIRIIVNTPPEVVEAAAPYAAEHGVWMGVEIHSPYSFDDEWIKRHLEMAERVGTDVVGCSALRNLSFPARGRARPGTPGFGAERGPGRWR